MLLRLKIPTGINALYKSGRNGWYKSRAAVDWQEAALWEIIKQRRGQTLPGGEKVYITWTRKDKRRFDIDGGIKLLLDTLVKARLIDDDSRITLLHVEKHPGAENGCEVNLP